MWIFPVFQVGKHLTKTLFQNSSFQEDIFNPKSRQFYNLGDHLWFLEQWLGNTAFEGLKGTLRFLVCTHLHWWKKSMQTLKICQNNTSFRQVSILLKGLVFVVMISIKARRFEVMIFIWHLFIINNNNIKELN